MADSTTEIIESNVPGQQELREANVAKEANVSTAIEKNEIKDDSIKTADEENAVATKDDFVYSPVITVTKEESTFTKGDLKLQKVIVSEDISDDSTTVNETFSITEAQGPNESHIEIRRKVQTTSTATNGNNDKENTDDKGKRSFKTTSKIPKLKFKQAIERIKKQQRMSDSAVEPSLGPTVRSALPRLKDVAPSPSQHDKKQDLVFEKNEQVQSPKLDEEFDKLYEEILEKEASNSIPSPEKISDPIKLESKFEEIIHAYDDNRTQLKSTEKVKSKIPLLKRKSEQEIEIPPPTYRRGSFKNSESNDSKDKNLLLISKEISLKSDIQSQHTLNAETQETFKTSEIKSDFVLDNSLNSYESTSIIKTVTTQKSSEMVELVNISSTEDRNIKQVGNLNLTSKETQEYVDHGFHEISEPIKESEIISETVNENWSIVNTSNKKYNFNESIKKENIISEIQKLSSSDFKMEEGPAKSFLELQHKTTFETNEKSKIDQFSNNEEFVKITESQTSKNKSSNQTSSINSTHKEVYNRFESENRTYDEITSSKVTMLTDNNILQKTSDTDNVSSTKLEDSVRLSPENSDIATQNIYASEYKNQTSENESSKVILDYSKNVNIELTHEETNLVKDYKVLSSKNEKISNVEEFSKTKTDAIETIKSERIISEYEGVKNITSFENKSVNLISSMTENNQNFNLSDKKVSAEAVNNLKTSEKTTDKILERSISNQKLLYENNKDAYDKINNSSFESTNFTIENTADVKTTLNFNETKIAQDDKKMSVKIIDQQTVAGFITDEGTKTTFRDEAANSSSKENAFNNIKLEHKDVTKDNINKITDESKNTSKDCQNSTLNHPSKDRSWNAAGVISTNTKHDKGENLVIQKITENKLTTAQSTNKTIRELKDNKKSKQSLTTEEKSATNWSSSKNVSVIESVSSSNKILVIDQVDFDKSQTRTPTNTPTIEKKVETLSNEFKGLLPSQPRNLDELEEEDIIILKGKVNRIIRRLDSKESKVSKKEIDDVPKDISVISKIALFEHSDNLDALSPENTNVELSRYKPKIVQEIFKTSINKLDTNNNESNLGSEIGQNKYKYNYFKDNKHALKNTTEEKKIITNESVKEHSRTTTHKFDIVKTSKTSSANKLKVEVNQNITSNEKYLFSKLEENNDVFIKNEGEPTSLEIWNQYRMRKELDTDVRRAKSLAELDVGNAVKGRVKQMVVRLNSIERMNISRKEIIDLREKPRMGSVSQRIALFERKLVPIRGEDEHPRSTSKPSEVIEAVNEEKIKEKIEELTSAKNKYGKMNMTYMELGDGSQMPVLAVGTAMLEPKLLKHIIHTAIELGYRGFDTAYIYGNEREVGEAIRDKIKDGTVKREELYIISKLWSTFHRRDLVEKACRNSLQETGFDYFDLFLIHNPMSFKEGPNPLPKIANVLQYSEHDYLDAWFGIEDLVRKGLVRRGGVSNFNSVQIDRIIEKGKIKPLINQVECHPYLSQSRLSEFCEARNVRLSCYSVLGSLGTPPQLKSALPPVLHDPLVRVIAAGLGASPAQLLISYQLQQGRHVVVKSSSGAHLWDNLQALRVRLDHEHLAALNALNVNKRAFAFKGMGDTHKNYPFKIAF